MTEQHTLLWEPGLGAAPLPPLVDLSGVTQEEQPHVLLNLYRNCVDPLLASFLTL